MSWPRALPLLALESAMTIAPAEAEAVAATLPPTVVFGALTISATGPANAVASAGLDAVVLGPLLLNGDGPAVAATVAPAVSISGNLNITPGAPKAVARASGSVMGGVPVLVSQVTRRFLGGLMS